ncbi:MAG: hypothetical protein ACK5S6_02795, partial [bacterium]
AAGNPNPDAGYIMLKLADNYSRYFSGFAGQVAPVSGTPVTSVTAGKAYTIVSLGTATTAQWVAKGLPIGFTPAVGASFIATASGSIGGSAAVMEPDAAGSGIDHIEVVGNPNVTLANSAQPSNGGGYIILACFNAGVITAPADETVISLTAYLSDSSILIQGE